MKNIYDSYAHIRLVCSGSSSLEITKNIEFLTGRKIVFDITPFRFNEYLKAKSFKKMDVSFSLSQFEEIQEFYDFYSRELDALLNEY